MLDNLTGKGLGLNFERMDDSIEKLETAPSRGLETERGFYSLRKRERGFFKSIPSFRKDTDE